MTRALSGHRLTRALHIAVVLLAVMLTSCDRSSTAPLQPTPTPLPPAPPPVPATGPYVLTGLIFELTSKGPVPVADALVEVSICPQSIDSFEIITTDHTGMYRVAGMCAGTTYVWAGKLGYRLDRKGAPPCDHDCVFVDIKGDTRFDVELIPDQSQ
jgi:hypothetical protein